MYPLYHPHYDSSSSSSSRANDVNSNINAEINNEEKYYSNSRAQYYPSTQVLEEKHEYEEPYYANAKNERYGTRDYYNENDQTRYYGYDYAETSSPSKSYGYTPYNDYETHEKYGAHETQFNQEYENYYSYSNESRENERTDSSSHVAYYDASSTSTSSLPTEQAYDPYCYNNHDSRAPVMEYAHNDTYYTPAQGSTQEITAEGVARSNANTEEYDQVWREEYPNYTPYMYEHNNNDNQAYVYNQSERAGYSEPYNQTEYTDAHTDINSYYYTSSSNNTTALSESRIVPSAYTSTYSKYMSSEMDRGNNRLAPEQELLKRHRTDAYLPEHSYYPQKRPKLEQIQKSLQTREPKEEEEEEYIPPFAPRVEIPDTLPLSLRSFLDLLAHYVVQGGPTVEEEIVAREIYNEGKKVTPNNSSNNKELGTDGNKSHENTSSPFYFLNARFDDPRQRYYRWRLYSLLQGDEMDKWRTRPFQVERGNRAIVYLPPPLPPKGVWCLQDAYNHLHSTRKPVVRNNNSNKKSISSSSSSSEQERQEENANSVEPPSCALGLSFGLTSQGHVFRTLTEEEMSEWNKLLTLPNYNNSVTDNTLSSTLQSSSTSTCKCQNEEVQLNLFTRNDVARCMVFAIDHATCAHHLMCLFTDNIIALAYKTAALITTTTTTNKTTSKMTSAASSNTSPSSFVGSQAETNTAANVKNANEMPEHELLSFVNNMCAKLLWYLFVLNDIAHNSHAEELTLDELDEMYMNKNTSAKESALHDNQNSSKNDNLSKFSNNEVNKHKNEEVDVLELLAAKTKLAMSHRQQQQQQQRFKDYNSDNNKDNLLVTNNRMYSNKKWSKAKMTRRAIPPAIQAIVGLHAAFELIVPIFIESYLLSTFAMLHKLGVLQCNDDNENSDDILNKSNSLLSTNITEAHMTRSNVDMKTDDISNKKSKNYVNGDTNKEVIVQISVPNENSSYNTNNKIKTEVENMLLTKDDCVLKVISLLYWLRTLLINWCPSFVIESALSTLHANNVTGNKNSDGDEGSSNIYGINKLSDSSKAVLTARTASLLVERYAFLFKLQEK